jgi:Mor family transcriptional regulator
MSGIINEMRRVVADVVGDEKQASDIVFALISNFGGLRLYMPANDYETRNRELKELFMAGATIDHLARRYRISVKTVYRILGKQ